MKKLLLSIIFCLTFSQAVFAAQLGITPCTASGQPADLNFSGVSSNRKMSVCGETVVVFNNSADTDARFKLGSASNTTAALTDLLLPFKSFIVLNVGTSGLYFAVISSGTGTISFIQGTAAP